MIPCVSRSAASVTRRRRFSTTHAALSSVNVEEIAHFSRLSSLWWDEQGEFKLLHRMNPVRAKFVRDKIIETRRDDGDVDYEPPVLSRPLQGLRVLDVGCGGGLLSEVCIILSD